MKQHCKIFRNLSLLSMLAVQFMAVEAKTRVIKNPQIAIRTSSGIGISQIEMNDSVTRVSFHIDDRPGSTIRLERNPFLVDRTSGIKYEALRYEGIGESRKIKNAGIGYVGLCVRISGFAERDRDGRFHRE